MAVGADGSLAVAGQVQLKNSNGHISDALFVLRTDSEGNAAVLHTFGGHEMGASVYAVQDTQDGGFIVSRATDSLSADDTLGGALLAKPNGAASLGGCPIETVRSLTPSTLDVRLSDYAMTVDAGSPTASMAVFCGGPPMMGLSPSSCGTCPAHK